METPFEAAVPEAQESRSSHKPVVSSHSSPATSLSASDPTEAAAATGGYTLKVLPPALEPASPPSRAMEGPTLASLRPCQAAPPCSLHPAPSPSRKLWPLPQSTMGWPTSFSSHGLLSPQAPLTSMILSCLHPDTASLPPCFSLRCLASSLASPLKQPSLWGQLPQAIYRSPTSLLPLYLQTSFSPRLGQRRVKLGSSDEQSDPNSLRVSKPPSIPPISPTCHLRLLQPAWVQMLPLPHLAGSIWLQPELLYFLKPPDG